ncbi:Uncharacterised protein [Candidatus Gugararchaeum adminiculabundum]|nr:Uncharacterised protein [Candidatus Gugararchaeum adminiculabundum]
MKGDMALETIAKLFIILVVLALSISLIYKFYNDAQKIDLTNGGGKGAGTGLQVLRLATADNAKIAALADECYERFLKQAAKKQLEDCYVVNLDNGKFSDFLTLDGLKANMKNPTKIQLGTIYTQTVLISYDLTSDKVVVSAS